MYTLVHFECCTYSLLMNRNKDVQKLCIKKYYYYIYYALFTCHCLMCCCNNYLFNFRWYIKSEGWFNEHCIAVCRAADTRLNHICTQLSSGEILVKELLRVKEREQHLLILCEAAKMVSISVQETLKQRMHELICYKSHCDLLYPFLSHSGLLQDMQGAFLNSFVLIDLTFFSLHCFSGLNELHGELRKDINNLSIRALCTSSSPRIVKVTIPAAGALNNIAQMFHIMTSKYPSSTFHEFWKSHLNNAIGKYMSFGNEAKSCTICWSPLARSCPNHLNHYLLLVCFCLSVYSHKLCYNCIFNDILWLTFT